MPLSAASKNAETGKGVGCLFHPDLGKKAPDPFSAIFSLIVLALIRGYQLLVRPLLAGTGSCRFVPSCSEYAAGCVHTHGVARGSWLALKRMLRCHPFGGHGLDPVP